MQGYSSAAVTLDVYADLIGVDLGDVVNRLDSAGALCGQNWASDCLNCMEAGVQVPPLTIRTSR